VPQASERDGARGHLYAEARAIRHANPSRQPDRLQRVPSRFNQAGMPCWQVPATAPQAHRHTMDGGRCQQRAV